MVSQPLCPTAVSPPCPSPPCALLQPISQAQTMSHPAPATENEFEGRDAQGLVPATDKTPSEAAEMQKYMKMLFGVVPVIGQGLAWGTYFAMAYGGGQKAAYDAKFAFAHQHQLGYVGLAVGCLSVARKLLVVSANGARAPARVDRCGPLPRGPVSEDGAGPWSVVRALADITRTKRHLRDRGMPSWAWLCAMARLLKGMGGLHVGPAPPPPRQKGTWQGEGGGVVSYKMPLQGPLECSALAQVRLLRAATH